jgi:vacuolar-type H+-ATPase subunit I/STV1
MQRRRQIDRYQQQIDEFERRLKEISTRASSNDPALDAELRAIYASLPHYKEALQIESDKRARGDPNKYRRTD